jgi:DNA-binding MarR family transcriptional regulator
MAQDPISPKDVDSFILNEVDSVPHLEALLILRARRPKSLSPGEVASQLYINKDSAAVILEDLERRGLLHSTPGDPSQFLYSPSEELEALIKQVEITYRRELVRVANMIHSKASSAVRDFARAFRFTKEKPE